MNLIGQQLDGEIVRWQDDKGFGFIRSSKLSKDVFFHIRAYRASGKRPQVGERVVFVLEQNREGKLKAVQVQEWQFVRQKQVRQRRRQEQQAAFESGQTAHLLMVAAVYAALAVLVFMGKLPIEVWLWYAGLGALTFLFYWKDKRAAQQGGWRTPEKTLHLLSLLVLHILWILLRLRLTGSLTLLFFSSPLFLYIRKLSQSHIQGSL